MDQKLPGLDRFLHAITDAVVVVDAGGRVLHLNPAAETVTGWSAADACGRGVAEVVVTDADLASQLSAVLVQGEARECSDILLADRHGRRHRINKTIYPVRGPEGAIAGAAIIFRDITEIYVLREERRIAAMAFEIGAPLLIASAADGKVIRVNGACVELSGFSEAGLVEMSLEQLYRGADKAGCRSFLRDPNPPDTLRLRTTRLTRAGVEVQVSETLRKIRDERGAVTHFVIALYDLTEVIAATRALQDSQRSYQQLIEAMRDGVAGIRGGCIIECNQQFANMVGRERAAVVGMTVLDLSGEMQPGGPTQERIAAVTAAAFREGDTLVEWQITRPDDAVGYVEASISRASLQGQAILLVTTRDVTERHHADRERQRLVDELAAREKLIRLANRTYGIASWELDIGANRMRWTPGAEEVLGLAPNTLDASVDSLSRFIVPEDLQLAEATMTESIRSRQGFDLDVRLIDRDGKVRWTHTRAEIECNSTGVPAVLRGAVADISAQRASQETIERLAYFDPLTQLPNRRLLFDRLRQAVAAVRRSGGCGAVLFIDLDHFKRINDSLGHRAGDDILIEVAKRLRGLVRDADTIARLGGDEFVVILHSVADAAVVRRAADRVRERLSGDYTLAGNPYRLSVSVGVTLFPEDGEDAMELLHRADAAMYQAKKEGRSTVSFYQPELQDTADERLAIERGLRTALAEHQLELYYQPKVLDGHRVVGAEALLRWNHPERGLIPPGDFIGIAEHTGLIVEIGAWVLDTACRQLAQWNRSRPPEQNLVMAVNVSPVQFRNPDFVACVQQALAEHRLDSPLLTLEITEGILIDKVEETVARLSELKALGVNLSIDDFGTGYSSLNYLKRLPLDEIKIDRSFVANLIEDPNNAAIVRSMVAIAAAFSLHLVAEGVETAAEAEFLQALGCYCHQGYLYAKPLRAAEFGQRYGSAVG